MWIVTVKLEGKREYEKNFVEQELAFMVFYALLHFYELFQVEVTMDELPK